MKLNKTFLLSAFASYTEGSMLIVIDSLDEFVRRYKEYHAKKCAFMLTGVPEFYNKTISPTCIEWQEIVHKHDELEKQFVSENNQPFDFEFETGCTYIKEGPGAGNFHNDVKIKPNPGPNEDDYWQVVREFLSNLPTGTHYCGDYCA